MVGPKNAIQMITDNGANCEAAGRKITKKYIVIYWPPCATHCINLIMKDIVEMSTIQSLAILASKESDNPEQGLNWLRKQPNWTEFIHLGATHFAITFIALKSLHDRKDYLQSLVVYANFKKI